MRLRNVCGRLRGGEQLVETKALMNPAQGNSLVQTYGWGADS